MAAPASGFLVHRTSNSQWLGNGPAGSESLSAIPYQAYVDFDMLGDQFWVVFAGNLASTGFSGQIWRLRVGGTWGVVDGTIAMQQTMGVVTAFHCFTVKQLVTNVWTGVQLVKLTGELAFGGAFAQRPTLYLLPVL